MQKTLVVGASGQVGSQLQLLLASQDGPESVISASRKAQPGVISLDLSEMDSLDAVQRLLRHYDLSAIYCVAGMTHVDRCETEPDLAYRVNTRGPALLAEYAALLNLPFVFYSTDYVFDGTSEHAGPYSESATTAPLNIYGRSKLEGEKSVLEKHKNALIIRTTGVYGSDPGAKNFLYTVVRLVSQGHPLRVPQDQISTPAYNKDLAIATVQLVEAGASGVVHLGGPEIFDRLSFARAIADNLGLQGNSIEGLETSSLQQTAARPLKSGLVSERMPSLLPAFRMRPLAETIADCRPQIDMYLASLPR